MYPTLRDIAKITHVSPKTVSRVINEERLVNEKTRTRVLQAIQDLGYRPNHVARSLRQNKTHTIGYIIPDMANPFFGLVGRAIEKTLRQNGYSLIVSSTNNTPQLEIDTLNLLISKKVDGIICATLGDTKHYLKHFIERYQLPVVAIDNRINGLECDTVLHDNEQGTYLLTHHLITHGHRHISFIGGPLNQTSGVERFNGYKKALYEHDIELDSTLVRIGDWQIMSGFQIASNLLDEDNRCSAIVSANSLMALGILRALRKKHLKVPQDIALASFDDFDFTEVTDPPLTTLKGVESEIGKSSAKILLEKIEGSVNNQSPKEIIVSVQLMVRESCGCFHE